MGVETSRAIRARQRATAARVDRLIARRDEQGSRGEARRRRISVALREACRALRARGTAQEAVGTAEGRAGVAMVLIASEGLSFSDVFCALGVSESVGRRLVEIGRSSTTRAAAGLSTDAARGGAVTGEPGDRGSDGVGNADALTEGRL
jgi:hypothetical protein